MRLTAILFFACTLLWSFSAEAQQSFHHICEFGFNANVHTSALMADGSIIIAGNMEVNGPNSRAGFLVNATARGQILWSKKLQVSGVLDIKKVIVAKTGAIICSGSISTVLGYYFFIASLTPDGNMIWNKVFSYGSFPVFPSVVETYDGFLLTASTYFPGSGATRGLLFKFNATGQPIWQRNIGFTEPHNVSFDDAIENPDHTITLAGTLYEEFLPGFTALGRLMVTRISSEGEIEKNLIHYESDSNLGLIPSTIIPMSGGGLCIGGLMRNNEYRTVSSFVMRLDSNWSPSWTLHRPSETHENIRTIKEISNGGVIASTETASQWIGADVGQLIRIDSAGAVKDIDSLVSTQGSIEGISLVPIPDGRFMLSGSIRLESLEWGLSLSMVSSSLQGCSLAPNEKAYIPLRITTYQPQPVVSSDTMSVLVAVPIEVSDLSNGTTTVYCSLAVEDEPWASERALLPLAPNPASVGQSLSIEYPADTYTPCEILLRDLTGRILLRRSILPDAQSKLTLTLPENLLSGVYLVEIFAADNPLQRRSAKVVIE